MYLLTSLPYRPFPLIMPGNPSKFNSNSTSSEVLLDTRSDLDVFLFEPSSLHVLPYHSLRLLISLFPSSCTVPGKEELSSEVLS